MSATQCHRVHVCSFVNESWFQLTGRRQTKNAPLKPPLGHYLQIGLTRLLLGRICWWWPTSMRKRGLWRSLTFLSMTLDCVWRNYGSRMNRLQFWNAFREIEPRKSLGSCESIRFGPWIIKQINTTKDRFSTRNHSVQIPFPALVPTDENVTETVSINLGC